MSNLLIFIFNKNLKIDFYNIILYYYLYIKLNIKINEKFLFNIKIIIIR